jgi:flagellar biosynthesis protein FlhG
MIMRDQAAKLRELVQQKVVQTNSNQSRNARVIAVTSGKGGVGKSNVTVNLAIALARQGKRVLVIDVDLGTANVDLLLGRKAVYNFRHVLERSHTITDIISEGPGKIRYISGGSGIQELANLTEMELFSVTSQLSQLDDWADIILLDTGAGISRNIMHFVTCADEVIVITTPEPTAITDAYAVIKATVHSRKELPMRVIVNRVISAEEARGVVARLNRVCRQFLSLAIPELGFVIEDELVGSAVRRQYPFYLLYPDATASHCITKIATALLQKEPQNEVQGIKGFLYRFMERFLV